MIFPWGIGNNTANNWSMCKKKHWLLTPALFNMAVLYTNVSLASFDPRPAPSFRASYAGTYFPF